MIKYILIAAFTVLFFFNSVNAAIISYKKDTDGVNFKLDKGLMKIKICNESMVQVKYSSLDQFSIKKSLMINNDWKAIPQFLVSENKNEVIIATSRILIKINKATNAIKYNDLNNLTILEEDATNGKQMLADTIVTIPVFRCETQFLSPFDEALYGLGCHPEDTLSVNYKGRNQNLGIKYLTGAIPVLLSTKGYGLMWDNYSESNFYGAEADNTKFKYVSESGTMVDYYFMYGPDFDKIIALYRTATGAAPMFPKWAFGLFQSQDRYQSQAEVLSVKNGYRNNNIPVDCIVQDWFYWEPNVIGSHVMYPTRFPNPKKMVDELHKANIHAMISIWPVFAKGTPNYDQLNKEACLSDIKWDNINTHTFDNYYDAHNPRARELYWQQVKDSLFAPHGWDALWVDQCEPDNGSLTHLRKQTNYYIGKGIDYYNSYSLMHTEGLYNNWRKDIADKRLFSLVRQTYAGQQRNAATLWSGDVTCTWRALKSQVPQGINACASGTPYWTSDIGGYHFNWGAPDWSTPANNELFTRWFQFGTFSPIFRIHGKGERAMFSDNWTSKTKSILLKYDHLRYRLMPYIYSLSGKVTNQGYTMMRSLAFDFRDDANIYSIPDQYMFGSAFLVCPVTTQMYSNDTTSKLAKTRTVYLPKSTQWYDFWTGNVLNGGQSIEAQVPIETIPLYIKAGSIIPMGQYLQHATEKPADVIEVRIYPGNDGKFLLYEDENDNYNYEKGKFATIEFAWNEKERMLTIGNQNGSFTGMLNKRKFNIVIVKQGNGVGVDINPKFDKTIEYSGKRVNASF
ncbi:MAG: DUF5110 domain-containing protein [Cytophagales bacterium]|nr:MAG: DUF5110 domain-containing protein [Cytophagales bacterium]